MISPLAVAVLALLFLAGAGTIAVAALRQSTLGLRPTGRPRGVKVSYAKRLRWYAANAHGPGAMLLAPLAAIGLPAIMGAAYKQPANDVYSGGIPREWCVVNLKVKTVTSVRSGRVGKKDTTDDEFQLAAAGDTNGLVIVGTRNWTNPAWDHTTAPVTGDEIECYYLVPGIIAKFRNGANLAAGARAQIGATALAAGAVAAAGDTAKHICRVLTSTDGSGAETDILAVVL